jgi:hypothetical protein
MTNKGELKVPTSEGGRLVICHAGGPKFRFKKGCKMVFRARKGGTGKYHSEMNSQTFKECFFSE